MLLPIGDGPNPRATPWLTYALIALNVLVYALITVPLSGAAADPADPAFREYLAMLAKELGRAISIEEATGQVTAYDLAVFRHGFRPGAPSPLALLTSMFLHAGLLHLAGNMLFLWIYGNNVEHRLGKGWYLAAYLATGAAAALSHAALNAGSDVPTVGASGAISGVLGFYFVFFPRNHVRVLVFLLPVLARVFEVPARLVLGAYLVLDNLLPYALSESSASGVAYGAHIGGFVAGLGAAFVLDRLQVTQRPVEYRSRVERPGPREDAVERLRELVAAGHIETAARRYFETPTAADAAVEPEVLLELARGLAQAGHADAALTLFRRIAVRHPRGPIAAEAHAGAAEVLATTLGQRPSAFQHLIDTVRLDPDGEAAARARRELDRMAREYRPPLQDRRWR